VAKKLIDETDDAASALARTAAELGAMVSLAVEGAFSPLFLASCLLPPPQAAAAMQHNHVIILFMGSSSV
jgi:hypothetical protein